MTILVLSDSHSELEIMRSFVQETTPDAIIHLGDYFRDGEELAQEFSGIPFYQVPGNCDRYSAVDEPETVVTNIFGVRFFLTHGHRHGVKSYLYKLIADGRASNAKAVLFGHTHEQHCHQEEDGIWIFNPGSCGTYGRSAGVIEVERGEIQSCEFISL